jgi:poly(hydroxyalkanoate) depolymerase family esterase
MTSDFGASMRQALQLTRAQKLIEATQVIRRALAGRGRSGFSADQPHASAPLLPPSDAQSEPPPAIEPARASASGAAPEPLPAGRPRRPLGEVLKALREADLTRLRADAPALPKRPRARPVPVPAGASYLARTFACEAGAREYKLYVPSRADGRSLPLIVMLHGCTQNPDDFALGTAMNRLAEENGLIVAYPKQPASANQSACWNWFNPGDQRRDEGEPGVIAGLTRSIMAEFAVDGSRVYVAGLSAGGAMTAIMSALYPDLYAAAGIHSGLPFGSADDLPSALAAMRGAANPSGPGPKRRQSRSNRPRGGVRTIVFHGSVDKTVDPSNAQAILADARAVLAEPQNETRQDGVAGGRAYRRIVVADARGVPHAEEWVIEGLGHAWSGGSPDGSFTDQRGPDASREMLRFFLATPAD